MPLRALLVLTPALILSAAAQDRAEAAGEARSTDGTVASIRLVPPPGQYTPMTAEQKLSYNFLRTFDAGALTRNTISAGFDQILDNPEPWPGQPHGFGIRFTSKIGHRLAKHMVMTGVQTLMHDDPRSLPTTVTGFWPRTRQAIANTYRIKHDDGTTVHFNYSRLIAAYGSAFVSRTWHPEGYRSPGDALMTGTTTLGIDAGMSVFLEFWPDIKRRVFRIR